MLKYTPMTTGQTESALMAMTSSLMWMERRWTLGVPVSGTASNLTKKGISWKAITPRTSLFTTNTPWRTFSPYHWTRTYIWTNTTIFSAHATTNMAGPMAVHPKMEHVRLSQPSRLSVTAQTMLTIDSRQISMQTPFLLTARRYIWTTESHWYICQWNWNWILVTVHISRQQVPVSANMKLTGLHIRTADKLTTI